MSTRAPDRTAVIVGAGLMGRWHAHAVRAIGGRIVAVVDADIARAQGLARRHGARATTQLADALAVKPAVVHVCTPAESHVALASMALDGGAHVLVEKPFAPTVADTRTILARAQSAGRLACPVHQFLWQRGVRRAIADLPAYGPVLHADFVACSAGAEESQRKDQLVADILPHPLSLLRGLFATPLDVSAWLVTTVASGEARFSGSVGQTTVSILVSAAGRPTRNTVRLIGARGTMHLDLFHGFAAFEHPAVSRVQKIARPFRLGVGALGAAVTNLAIRTARGEPAYPGLRELIRAFYSAVAGTGTPPIAPDDTVEVAVGVERLAALLRTPSVAPARHS